MAQIGIYPEMGEPKLGLAGTKREREPSGPKRDLSRKVSLPYEGQKCHEKKRQIRHESESK